MIKNRIVAAELHFLASLMQLNKGDNFKINALLRASTVLKTHPKEVASLTEEEIAKITGIGRGISNKIEELLTNGFLYETRSLAENTPLGLVDLLNLNGLGPSTIHKLWKKFNVTDLTSLKAAIEEQKRGGDKLFAPKTLEKVCKEIAFFEENEGRWLYPEALNLAGEVIQIVQGDSKTKIYIAGELRRRLPVVSKIEFLVAGAHEKELCKILAKNSIEEIKTLGDNKIGFRLEGLSCEISILSNDLGLAKELFKLTGDEQFVAFCSKKLEAKPQEFSSEEDIFKALEMPFIPPNMREGHNLRTIKGFPKTVDLGSIVQVDDIKGLLHNHSTYSDGRNSIAELAQECINMGYEYLGICDHSKSAVYANGLSEARIYQQLAEIEILNQKLKPFKIFRGIEVDIMKSGELDYAPGILKLFDFVVASIHSKLNMNPSEATERMLAAISNPFVDIIAHPTGRLLTKRNGYALNWDQVFAACQKYNVSMELNCSPQRQDLDWKHLHEAYSRNIFISLNPDAHSVAALHNIFYGLETAQKGLLPSKWCLNALNKQHLEDKFKAKRLRG